MFGSPKTTLFGSTTPSVFGSTTLTSSQFAGEPTKGKVEEDRDVWYKRAMWKISVPLNESGFTHKSNEIKLNLFFFSVSVSVVSKAVADPLCGMNKQVLCPKIFLNLRLAEDVDTYKVVTEWTASYVNPSEEKQAVSNTGVATFDKSTSERQLLVQARNCPWLLKEDVCLVTVLVKLKTPLTKLPLRLPALTFSENWNYSDVVFVVEGINVHVHRQMLSCSSPVFLSMLYSDFKEKESPSIQLPGKRHKDFVDFMQLIYRQSDVSNLLYDDALRLLPLFHEYQVALLEDKAQEVLLAMLEQSLSSIGENPFRCLEIADRYGYETLKHEALRKLCRLSTMELVRLKWFLDASDEHQAMIKEARLFYLEEKKCSNCGM